MSFLAGRYEMFESLGEGGMATVHRAWDRTLQRDVAVKTMRAGLDALARPTERFLREARALARIDHPGIVRVHDCGIDGDVHYVVLELLRGTTLREHLDAHGSVELSIAIGWLRDVTEALGAAHAHGVIHRDVKPDNIMLVRDAAAGVRARVIDFGIAHVVGEERLSGQVRVGTLAHMAPEQVRGDAPTPATDVYGLGLLLYELITGVHPHPRDDVGALLRAILEQEVQRPSRHNPLVPAVVDAIVLRCLDKDPHQRFVDAAALWHELQTLEDVPTTPTIDVPVWIGATNANDATGLYASRLVTVDDARRLGFVARGVRGAAWTNVDADRARAYAARVGGRIPTEREWSSAAASGLLDDVARCWEWTSTARHDGLGWIVRGGPWRDRKGMPAHVDNASWEDRGAPDVGFRVVFDVAKAGTVQ